MYDMFEVGCITLAGLLLLSAIGIGGWAMSVEIRDRLVFIEGCEQVRPAHECAYMWSRGEHHDVNIDGWVIQQ